MNPFDSVHDHSYGANKCFLCGAPLSDASRSDEHVFPRWLQKQFRIRDLKIDLLNRVPVIYRKLTVPCCIACNTGPLSELEKRVRKHLALPVVDLGKDERTDLFLWAGKILYGLLYRQTAMAFDPADRQGPTILDATDLSRFKLLHMFLQGIRRGFGYWGETDVPATLFVYDVECPDDVQKQFDWQDAPSTGTIYLRLGHRGLVMCLDGGAQEIAVGDLLRRYQGRTLHPLQFEEVGAKLLYKATIAERRAVFYFQDGAKLFCSHLGFDYPEAPAAQIVQEGDDDLTRILYVPHPLDDGRPLFGDWDKEHYFSVLAKLTGFPQAELLKEDGTGVTWLIDREERDITFSIQDYPYR